MADKFEKGDIVEFNIGTRKMSGTITKIYHSRYKSKLHPTAYLVMTDYEIVSEDELTLKEW